MFFYYLLAKRQADPRSLKFRVVVQALKHSENFLGVFLVETDPVVLNVYATVLRGGIAFRLPVQ